MNTVMQNLTASWIAMQASRKIDKLYIIILKLVELEYLFLRYREESLIQAGETPIEKGCWLIPET